MSDSYPLYLFCADYWFEYGMSLWLKNKRSVSDKQAAQIASGTRDKEINVQTNIPMDDPKNIATFKDVQAQREKEGLPLLEIPVPTKGMADPKKKKSHRSSKHRSKKSKKSHKSSKDDVDNIPDDDSLIMTDEDDDVDETIRGDPTPEKRAGGSRKRKPVESPRTEAHLKKVEARDAAVEKMKEAKRSDRTKRLIHLSEQVLIISIFFSFTKCLHRTENSDLT